MEHTPIMVINFNNDAWDSYIWSLNKLRLLTVDIDVSNDAYPHDKVVIASADDDGVKVWESNETGDAIKNASWVIPHHVINSITVI